MNKNSDLLKKYTEKYTNDFLKKMSKNYTISFYTGGIDVNELSELTNTQKKLHFLKVGMFDGITNILKLKNW